MKSVVLSALFGMTLWLGLPASASAQEPEPAPAPAPQAPPPPPRDVAVPRSERVAPREGPARAPETRSRESGASEGRERQSQPSENRAPARAPERVRETDTDDQRRQPIGAASTAAADGSDEQGAQRRGASRRPPSSGSDGAQARDRAVARSSAPRQEPTRVYLYPDYWSYNRYSSRYYNDPYYGGFGLGYLQYSPWGWTPAFYGDPYAYAYGGGYSGAGYSPRGEDVGSVKLKVSQRDAEVFVDGYFAGYVDDFDGFLQALKLDSGAHRVEIRKPGYETLHFDVRVRPNRNITFRGEMKPVL